MMSMNALTPSRCMTTRTPLLVAAVLLAASLLAPPLARAQGLTWDQLGPAAALGYATIGADSMDAVYVRNRATGIYRSTDRGERWELVAPHAMTSFAATRSGIVIVDGTGRLLRSTDRGVTWAHIPAYSQKGDTTMSAINAASDGTLYAMTRVFFPTPAEILRSTDDGASWQTLLTPGERGVRIVGLAADGSLLINADQMAYRSSDRGERWDSMTVFGRAIGDLRFDGAGRLYTAFGRALAHSSDHGVTWTLSDTLLMASYSHIAVAHDGTVVLAGTGSVVSSTDRGASWTHPEMPRGMLSPLALIALGNHFFASGTAGSVATEGAGILRSIDRGASFQPVGRGLPGPPIAAVHIVGDSVVFASSPEYVAYRMVRTTGAWQTLERGNPRVERGPDGALYRIAQKGYARSTDAGLTWQSADTSQSVYTVFGAPGPGGVYVAATQSGALMRTRGFGGEWERLDTEFVETVTAIAFDSGGAIIVGTEQSGLFRYDEAADRFRGLNARVTSTTISDIVVTTDGTILVATMGAGIRRSSDGGATFRDANVGLRSLNVSALAFTGTGVLLAATDSSLFLSRTGGDVWGFEGAGLPPTATAIAVDAADRIIVGTNVGLFISRESAAGAPMTGARGAELAIHVAPNPAASLLRVELSSHGRAVRVSVADLLGRTIATLHDGALAPGATSLSLDVGAMPAGAYRIVVASGGRVTSAPMIVAR